MTTRDRPILLGVNYMLARIHILGKISYEMIRFPCLVRPKLSNVHGSLLAALLIGLYGEGCCAWYPSLQVGAPDGQNQKEGLNEFSDVLLHESPSSTPD
jgi:hypothetical protein